MPRRINLICMVFGHSWKRRPERGRVLLTCRRCGYVDAVDKDLGGFGLF